ncbi:hypothetical protein Sjap_017674 [Stephania japonica]|uniref:Uncharacterized protein n=1 Tax=Stephania japonica TaxID=461633 RepID=A0AAP0NK74_9MAGN
MLNCPTRLSRPKSASKSTSKTDSSVVDVVTDGICSGKFKTILKKLQQDRK